jgi:hypothetical protein
MKVKITMEADVSDLEAFNDNQAGRENILDIIKEIHTASTEKLMRLEINGEKNVTPKYYQTFIKNYRADKELTSRLISNVDIKFS